MLTCNRALMANINSLTTVEIEQSINYIKNWIKSGNYRYDISLLLNRLKDLEERVSFEGANDEK